VGRFPISLPHPFCLARVRDIATTQSLYQTAPLPARYFASLTRRIQRRVASAQELSFPVPPVYNPNL